MVDVINPSRLSCMSCSIPHGAALRTIVDSAANKGAPFSNRGVLLENLKSVPNLFQASRGQWHQARRADCLVLCNKGRRFAGCP